VDIVDQQTLRNSGITAFGFDGYQQIYSQYNSSFTFNSSLISYDNPISFPTKQSIDSCWNTGNVFRLDQVNNLIIKTNFQGEFLSSFSITDPYSLSVIQYSVPMEEGNPMGNECLGCWVTGNTSVYKLDKDLNVEVEITSLTSPTFVCTNYDNNGCYVIDESFGIYGFNENGDLIAIGNIMYDNIIEMYSNSNGELFILTESELYKLINSNGNIFKNIEFNLASYLTSQMAIGCFNLDTSTNYIYTGSGDNSTTRIVKFNSNGNHLGTLSLDGKFPYVLRVSQHPSSQTFYLIEDSSKMESVQSSSSTSSELYSEPSSQSSSSS